MRVTLPNRPRPTPPDGGRAARRALLVDAVAVAILAGLVVGNRVWSDVVPPLAAVVVLALAVTVVMVLVSDRRAAGERERAEAEADARHAEEVARLTTVLDAVIDHAGVGIGVWDLRWRYQLVNARLAALDGASPEEHLGRDVRDVLGPALGASVVAAFEQVVATAQPFRDGDLRGETGRGADPERSWDVTFYPVLDERGEVAAIAGTVRDTTAARLAAEAVARTNRELAYVAATLERSLRPGDLPEVPGLDLRAHYLPASSGVGGDIYDVFTFDGERWHVVVGDVCGSGTEAAALVAAARHLLRGIAAYEADPAASLHALNELLLPVAGDRFITMAHAVLERDGGGDGWWVALALAGHPRPLRATGGRCGPVGRHGSLLGVLPRARCHTEVLHLAPGDALLLFTDGLTDHTRRDLCDEDVLAGLLAGSAGDASAAAAALVERAEVLRAALSESDDIAFVCLGVPERAAVTIDPSLPRPLSRRLG